MAEDYGDTIRLLAGVPRPRLLRMTFKGGLTTLLAFPGPLVLLVLFLNGEPHDPTPGIGEDIEALRQVLISRIRIPSN
jgi:hypothetical protein